MDGVVDGLWEGMEDDSSRVGFIEVTTVGFDDGTSDGVAEVTAEGVSDFDGEGDGTCTEPYFFVPVLVRIT